MYDILQVRNEWNDTLKLPNELSWMQSEIIELKSKIGKIKS